MIRKGVNNPFRGAAVLIISSVGLCPYRIEKWGGRTGFIAQECFCCCVQLLLLLLWRRLLLPQPTTNDNNNNNTHNTPTINKCPDQINQNLESYEHNRLSKMSSTQMQSCTMACSNGKLVEKGKSTLSQATFLNDASKIWNSALDVIKNCQTIWTAKKEIKKICYYTSYSGK